MSCSIRAYVIIFKSLYALYLVQNVFGNFFSRNFKLTFFFFGRIGGIVAINDPIKGILPFYHVFYFLPFYCRVFDF